VCADIERIDVNSIHMCKLLYSSVHVYQTVALQSEAIQRFTETVSKSLFSSMFL